MFIIMIIIIISVMTIIFIFITSHIIIITEQEWDKKCLKTVYFCINLF